MALWYGRTVSFSWFCCTLWHLSMGGVSHSWWLNKVCYRWLKTLTNGYVRVRYTINKVCVCETTKKNCYPAGVFRGQLTKKRNVQRNKKFDGRDGKSPLTCFLCALYTDIIISFFYFHKVIALFLMKHGSDNDIVLCILLVVIVLLLRFGNTNNIYNNNNKKWFTDWISMLTITTQIAQTMEI